MERCECWYEMHDCELDYMHNFHHDGNIGNFIRVKALRYCDKRSKFLYAEDIETCQVGIPTVEMKKYLNLKYIYLCSIAKYGKNQFTKPSHQRCMMILNLMKIKTRKRKFIS